MVLATKERITAHRLFSTRRYILSTLPVLYISGRRDFQWTDQFLSDDGYGHLCTVTGALWTPQEYLFDGSDDKIQTASVNPSLALGNTFIIWIKMQSNVTGGNQKKVVFAHTSSFLLGLNWDNVAIRYEMAANTDSDSYRATYAYTPVGAWQFVVGRWNGLKTSLIIGTPTSACVLVSTAATNDTWTNASRPFSIMGSNVTRFLNQNVGEAMCYSSFFSIVEAENIRLATKWRYQ